MSESSYDLGWGDGYAEGYACKLADATEPFTPTSDKPQEVMAIASFLLRKYRAYFKADDDAIGAARGILTALAESRARQASQGIEK